MAVKLAMIFFSMILVNNYVLVQFLGICPFLGVSKKLDSAVGMSAAVIFVMALATSVTWPIYTYLLEPNGMAYLQTIVFILIIAVLVQLVEIILKKFMPPLYKALGVYLPLITTNCAVLGVTISVLDEGYNFAESLVCAVGAGVGFMVAMVLFSGVRKRLEDAQPPKCFEGLPITLVAAHFMHVEEDPRVGEVLGVLPGANCGACGYAGCADYAKAIVEGAPVNKCVPGGAKCAAAAAAIMGVEAGEVVKRKAIVACQGSYDHTQDKYEYEGIESCAACAALYSGRAACEYGCLGYGDCVKACKFDAITVSNGLARVNPEKCTGCGACEQACPKKVIWIRPESEKPVVMCANHDRGALTRKACTAGCIGCMKCEKSCPEGAIKVTNNVARVDYEKCTGCRTCMNVCPVHAITIPKIV